MKIKSYKKIKNNCYKVFLEKNQEEILYDEVILKHSLLLKKEITNAELEQIKKENEFFSCYYKAIQYLSYKNRSKKEIKEYLQKQNFITQDIERTIKQLEEKQIINDEKYMQMYIHDQVELTNNGPKKIEQKLLKLGFQEEKIKEELSKIEEEIWIKRLEQMIQKKIKASKKEGSNKIKEKIIYACLNEGYTKEKIVFLLNQIEIPKNEEALLKETQKLYKKLSLKYKDQELFYQLKGRLLNKGFSYEEIEEAIKSIKKTSI